MRRTTLLATLGAMLAALVVVGGVAWAAQNFIQCPNSGGAFGYCDGTDGNDVMKGTPGDDSMRADLGKDTLYGYKGADRLYGNEGRDVVYGGPGDDDLGSGCDGIWCGRDEHHGGPGDDHIVGNPASEKHFGGRGDDEIADYESNEIVGYDSSKYPDVIRCGPGHDWVFFDRGIDKVADDCEKLTPVKR